MLTCSKCGNTQEVGNFCESCGQRIASNDNTNQSQTTEHNVHNQSNTNLRTVKRKSRSFITYSIERFKQPNLTFKDNDHSFTSSLITVILLPLSIAIFLYGLANNLLASELPGLVVGDIGIPFLSTVSRVSFMFLLLFLSGYLATFTIMKIVKNPISSKQLFIRHAGFQTPFLLIFFALAILSLLGIVSIDLYHFNRFIWSAIIFFITLNIVLTINPIIITFRQLSLQQHRNSYYFSVLALLFNLLYIYIIGRLFFKTLMLDLVYIFLEPLISGSLNLLDEMFYNISNIMSLF